jgi:hypothetical protein
MGLIRDLIADHKKKEQEDWDKNYTHVTTLLGMPGLDPQSKQMLQDDVAKMFGDATGIPKAKHGIVSKLIGGMHDHLESLNPNPKDKFKGQLQFPQATKDYHPINDENALKDEAAKAQRTRDSAAADEQTKFEQKLKERKAALAQVDEFIKQHPQMSEVEKTDYEAQAIGLKPDPSTRPRGTLKQVKVTKPDGTSFQAAWNSSTNQYEDSNSQSVPVDSDWKIEPIATERKAAPAALNEKIAEFKANDSTLSDVEAAQKAGEFLLTQGYDKLAVQGAVFQARKQGIAVTGALSGENGSQLPPAPIKHSAAAASSTNGTPAAGATGGSGTGIVAPVKPGEKKPMSMVEFQSLVEGDPQMSMAYKSLIGLQKGVQRGPAMLGISKGIDKIRKAIKLRTGKDISAEDLSAEVTARENVKKAYGFGQQRLAAYDQAAGFVGSMGKAVEQAKAKFGNDPKFWQKVKNNWSKNVTGDPDTDALVTALNGYQSAYSRAISGGQMSTGQTHVAAQERAGQVIDAAMKGTEIKAVLDQVTIELKGERDAIVNNNKEQGNRLRLPLGEFDEGETVDTSGAAIGEPADSGTKKKADYTFKDGKLVKN